MRVFKRRARVDGMVQESRKWHVEIRLPDETRRQIPAFTDRRASAELGRRMEQLAALRAMDTPPDRGLLLWLDTVPGPMLKRLAALGLVEVERVASAKPLVEHIEDYRLALVARGDTDKHARQQAARVRRICGGCGVRRWGELKAGRVEAWMAERVDSGAFGVRTANHYQRALHGFGGWMVLEGRGHENPAARVGRRKGDPLRVRRALTLPEQRALVAAAESSGEVACGMDGPSRGLLYRLALTTGLRWGELGSLRARSFDLGGMPPTVTVVGAYTKNRKTATLPLRPDVAALVARVLRRALPEAVLFPNKRKDKGATMLRVDLAAAGIAYQDAQGRVVDFHALRHTFITALCRSGVHPKTAQTLARHSSITLTMDVYTQPAALETGAEAVGRLPGLEADAGKAREEEGRLRATGTG